MNTNQNVKKGYIEESFDIFSYKNLGQVRTYIDENGNKWFCLVDVCNILGLTNSRMVANRIPEPYVSSTYTGVSTGFKADGTPAIQNVPLSYVNEAGLYLAIGNSRKPEAKEFMVWVFGEVLPSLNKKGYYIMDNKPKEEVIEELKNEINSIKSNISYMDDMNKLYNETIINYAKKNGYLLYPKLTKMLEKEAIYEAKRFKEEYDDMPRAVYGDGFVSFRYFTVKYIFDRYYDKFKKELENEVL